MSHPPCESVECPTNELVQLQGDSNLVTSKDSKFTSHFSKPFSEQQTNGTLVMEVYKNKNIKLFLQLLGITWPFPEDPWVQKCSQSIWSGLMRFCIVGVNALATLFFSIAAASQRLDPQEGLIFALICITVLLQSFVLIPSLYTAHSRFNDQAMQIEIPFYDKSLKPALFVFVISLASGIIFPFYALNFGFDTYGAWLAFLLPAIIGEFAVASFLAMNMMFLSVDAKVCLSLVESLIDQHTQNTISMQSFTMVRKEIKRRVEKSKWKTNSVVCVAVLDIIVLVLIVLFGPEMVTASNNHRADDDTDDAYDPFRFSIPYFIAMSTFFIKELPFLVIVFWESAKVNEKSDLLIKLLGAAKAESPCSFGEDHLPSTCDSDQIGNDHQDGGAAIVNPITSTATNSNNNGNSTMATITVAERKSQPSDSSPLLVRLEQGYIALQQEYNRLSIYATAESDKISLPLAGMRLKRRDVVIRFGLWTITLFIGLIKAAIASGVDSKQ